MKVIASFFAVLLFVSSAVLAADSHYEVYYFYASWRCTNCTNAEEWAGEAVDMLQKANSGVQVAFVPKQLEKTKRW